MTNPTFTAQTCTSCGTEFYLASFKRRIPVRGRLRECRECREETTGKDLRMTQQIYTYEQYKPAYPIGGNYVRIHRGTFEDNRDSLSPSMVSSRDFYADNDEHALVLGAQCAALVAAEFEGFDND